MSKSYGLNAYKVEIRNKNARSVWTLRQGSKADGFAEINRYLKARETLRAIPDTDRALIVRQMKAAPASLVIDGMVSSGEAGAVRNLIDIVKGKRTYTTSKDEAVMAPNYFRFQLEDGRPFGVLIIEPGSTSILERDMNDYFNRLLDPLSISLKQIVSYEALKKLAKRGNLRKVILVNDGRSQASRAELRKTSIGSDKLGDDGDLLELSIKKKGNFSTKTLQRLFDLTKSDGVGKAVKTASLSEYDEVKVQVKMGRRTQTFSMSRPNSTAMRFDTSDRVKIGRDGHPTLTSLRKAAGDIYKNSIAPVI